MIARDIILFLLLNILPFIYLDWRYLHKKSSWGKRLQTPALLATLRGNDGLHRLSGHATELHPR